jgi:hypothetical protein
VGTGSLAATIQQGPPVLALTLGCPSLWQGERVTRRLAITALFDQARIVDFSAPLAAMLLTSGLSGAMVARGKVVLPHEPKRGGSSRGSQHLPNLRQRKPYTEGI